jgi:hypothetical protein
MKKKEFILSTLNSKINAFPLAGNFLQGEGTKYR